MAKREKTFIVLYFLLTFIYFGHILTTVFLLFCACYFVKKVSCENQKIKTRNKKKCIHICLKAYLV